MREELKAKIKELEAKRNDLAKEINRLGDDDSEFVQKDGPWKKEDLFEEFFKVQGQLIFYRKMGDWGDNLSQLWEESPAEKFFNSENLTQLVTKSKEFFENLKLDVKFEGEPAPVDTSWPVYQAVKNLLIADQLNNAVYTLISERERCGSFVPFSENDDEDVEKMFVPLLIVKYLITIGQEGAACSVVEFLVNDSLGYEDDED